MAATRARLAASPIQGEACACVVSTAVAYAAMPTNACWPNDTTPATPVSSTSPSATSVASPT
jgi:hypothetical protein